MCTKSVYNTYPSGRSPTISEKHRKSQRRRMPEWPRTLFPLPAWYYPPVLVQVQDIQLARNRTGKAFYRCRGGPHAGYSCCKSGSFVTAACDAVQLGFGFTRQRLALSVSRSGIPFWVTRSNVLQINQHHPAAPSKQVSLVQVIRPLGWTAYTVVVSVVVAHLLLAVVVTVIFGRAGKLSRIGNAWTAVSQLLGPTTDTWIRDADIANDKAVKSWLRVHGMHRTMVRVGNIDGRAQLVQKSN